MAIPMAASPVQVRSNRFSDEFPQALPRFSQESMARFPFLASYQQTMDQWYYDFRTVLRRNLNDLDAALEMDELREETETSISDLETATEGQQTDISDILARLGAIESDIVALKNKDAQLESEIDDILTTIGQIQTQLADHEARIAALESKVFNPDTIVGTTGEIDVAYSPGLITIGLVDPVSIAKGGTGAATATAAFDNLSPTTTRGDLIVRNATSNARLGIGSNGQYVGSNGTDTIFKTILSTEITNSTFVTSVSGTAGRISSTGGLTPVLDLIATAVTPNTYGSASQVAQVTVDAYGRLTGATDVAIAIDASAITSGTLAIARGGTNAGTALAAFNNLSPLTTRGDLLTRDASNNVRLAIGTIGKYLRTDGTDPSWNALLSSDLSGTITVSQGGTGATTLTGMLQGNGTSAVTAISGTDNYIPKWSSGSLSLTSGVYDSGSNLSLSAAYALSWGIPTPDTFLYRDGPDTIGQRNGSNAQIYRMYRTYTDSSTFEAVRLGWGVDGSGNPFASIRTQASGVGMSNWPFRFGAGSANHLIIDTNGNIGINTPDFGASMVGGMAHKNGTAPAGNVTDCFQHYALDIVAGNSAPHWRTENGTVVRLFRDTGWTLPTGTALKGGWDTATVTPAQVAQTVKAIVDHLLTGTGLLGA